MQETVIVLTLRIPLAPLVLGRPLVVRPYQRNWDGAVTANCYVQTQQRDPLNKLLLINTEHLIHKAPYLNAHTNKSKPSSTQMPRRIKMPGHPLLPRVIFMRKRVCERASDYNRKDSQQGPFQAALRTFQLLPSGLGEAVYTYTQTTHIHTPYRYTQPTYTHTHPTHTHTTYTDTTHTPHIRTPHTHVIYTHTHIHPPHTYTHSHTHIFFNWRYIMKWLAEDPHILTEIKCYYLIFSPVMSNMFRRQHEILSVTFCSLHF